MKIADFGIAAIAADASGLTASGSVIGTAHYIAPERERNPRIKTPQSDIYSLGITFLEACTGHTRPSQENLDLVPELLRPIIEKMARHHPSDRYQSVAEVIEALNSLSTIQLLHGRELQENESTAVAWHVNIAREVENALNLLLLSTSDTILDRWADLERKLDRLGDAQDHVSDTIKNIPGSVLAMIEDANREVLLGIVQRFDHATTHTQERDFFSPDPSLWSKFLTDTFKTSSYRPTKHLCLEGLAKFLSRFGSPGAKYFLYLTIQHIEDPSYMEHLALCLREVGEENVASILDGVPDQRELDLEALQVALNHSG